MTRKKSIAPLVPSSPLVLTPQGVVAVGFGSLLLLTPLLSTGLATFSGIYDQNMWVLAVTGTFLATVLVQWFWLPRRSFQWNWLDLLALGWGIWLFLTTLTSVNST